MQSIDRSEEFSKHFRKQSNSVLQEIIARPQDYDKQAIVAAEAELRSRGIDPAQITILPIIKKSQTKVSSQEVFKNYFRRIIYPSENRNSSQALDQAFLESDTKFKSWKTVSILWLIYFALDLIGTVQLLTTTPMRRLTLIIDFILIIGALLSCFKVWSMIVFIKKQKIGLLFFAFSLSLTIAAGLITIGNLFEWRADLSGLSTSFIIIFLFNVAILSVAILSMHKLIKGQLPGLHETTPARLKKQVIVATIAFLLFSFYYHNVRFYLHLSSPSLERSTDEEDLEKYYR